ncbi:MAG: substrate-binding domain-containing protein [Ignavibacteriales bacterium]|nr:substrate-binding domain-containing protein [Ignavibacteriales bacterium]
MTFDRLTVILRPNLYSNYRSTHSNFHCRRFNCSWCSFEACRENHVIIPDDISLITFDDPVFASYLSPALSAVEQPISKIAEMAVEMLYSRMKNPYDDTRKVLLEPKFNVRGSVMQISTIAKITFIPKTENTLEQFNSKGPRMKILLRCLTIKITSTYPFDNYIIINLFRGKHREDFGRE